MLMILDVWQTRISILLKGHPFKWSCMTAIVCNHSTYMQRSATDLAELCYFLLVSLFVSNYMETACTMDYPREQVVYIHLPYLPSLCLMLWRIHSWLDDVSVYMCVWRGNTWLYGVGVNACRTTPITGLDYKQLKMHIFGDIFYIDQGQRQITQLVTHQVYHNPPAMFTEVLNVPVALESDFVCWLLFIQN